jgi:cell division protein FtsI (penicillin-binding protein 3)
MSTSLLHLANAYTILANHGRKVQLTYEKATQPVEYEHVLNKNISTMILKMMQTAVQSGTGQEASLNKYTVSGKTGTVRLNKNGAYSRSNHNAIFVGITPSSDPEYVAAIIIRDPKKGNTSGGKNAAPIFREFMNHALNILEVYPDKK